MEKSGRNKKNSKKFSRIEKNIYFPMHESLLVFNIRASHVL